MCLSPRNEKCKAAELTYPLVWTGILVFLTHMKLCFALTTVSLLLVFCCEIYWESDSNTDTTNDPEAPGPLWLPCVYRNSLQLLEREIRGICNKVSQFRDIYMGPVVHKQYYTIIHRHLKLHSYG